MTTTTAGSPPHWGVWKFALPVAAGLLGLTVLTYAVATNLNRNHSSVQPPVETATPTPTQSKTLTPVPPIATPDISTEALQAIYDPLTGLSVAALIRNNSHDSDARNIEVRLNYGSQQQIRQLLFVERNGAQTVNFTGVQNFKPGEDITIEAILTPTANQHDPNEANNTTGSISVIYIPPPFTPTPSPTPKPKDTPTPTYTPKPATPTPTKQPPTPTSTPKPPTPTPTPSLEEIAAKAAAKTFEVYSNNQNFTPYLEKLTDYNSQTFAKNPNYQKLGTFMLQDFELVKRVVQAVAFLNTEEKPFNRHLNGADAPIEKTPGMKLDSKAVLEVTELYLKHREQNQGMDDPTGFATVFDLILATYALNTPRTLTLADGTQVDFATHVRTNDNAKTALITGADIWSMLALPVSGRMRENSRSDDYKLMGLSVPGQWAIDFYCPPEQRDPRNPCDIGKGQTVAAGPFTSNRSAFMELGLAPLVDDETEALYGNVLDYSKYKVLNLKRQEFLEGFDFQANFTADDLEALAMGNWSLTELRPNFRGRQDPKWDNSLNRYVYVDYSQEALKLIDEIVAYKAEAISKLDVRTRAFVDDTGDLNRELRQGDFSKDDLVSATKYHDSGAFRSIGYVDAGTDRVEFTPTMPSNKDILLYVTGYELRKLDYIAPGPEFGRVQFNTESAGILKVTDAARDVRGDYDAGYYWRVSDGGRVLSAGEPRVEALSSGQYPFVDVEKTHELWTMPGFKLSNGRMLKSSGAVWFLNPAMIDEGYNNKDPRYVNDVVAQRRGPWVLVFDNRTGTVNPALGVNGAVTNAVFKPSQNGLLLPDYSGFNFGYFNQNGGFAPLYVPNGMAQIARVDAVRKDLEEV